MKMPSPTAAPRVRPSSESPAWKITGWPCGERSMLSGPTTEKYVPRWLSGVLAGRVEEDPGLTVPWEGVVLVGVPEAASHRDVLECPAVPGGVVVVLVQAVVAGRAGIAAGDDVPAGSSAADQVERGQSASDVERGVERRRDRADQADVLGRDGERRQEGQRLEPVQVVGWRGRGDELAVDDEDEVEAGRFELPRALDVPADVDAGVAGYLRVEPGVLLARSADPDHRAAELELSIPHGGLLMGAVRVSATL